MPLYEYRCRTSDEHFAERRPFADADAAVTCPSGHDDAVRLLAAFAATGKAGAPAPSGGGCGAACACAH